LFREHPHATPALPAPGRLSQHVYANTQGDHGEMEQHT
jgi:hypothetical protein